MTSPAALLDRELYSESEAARLLGLPTSTLHYWLQGGDRKGVNYRPIIRPAPVERRWVTWAEFIEAGWLSTYRRNKKVPMVELRDFIERLREKTGVQYPLAHHRPFVSGKKLVLSAQSESRLDPKFYLITAVDDQLLLTHPAQSFIERVVWEGDFAQGWRPHDDRNSTVVVRPDLRFGRPSVEGVSTSVIFEQVESGASNDETAEDFEISVRSVRWAVSYENAQHAA